ncbi:hypothetical protein TNCV_878221 [Trichonephila clavipes]|nr:hypothetical protein TNCV_878221 [Trichonephila clavipes]
MMWSFGETGFQLRRHNSVMPYDFPRPWAPKQSTLNTGTNAQGYGQRQAYFYPFAMMNFVGLDLTTSDRFIRERDEAADEAEALGPAQLAHILRRH